jgi:CRP-like cAMP-binding protein
VALAGILLRLESPALAGTFLRRLPSEVRDVLLESASLVEVPRRRVIFSSSGPARVGFVVGGLARTYLEARDGRRLTVRFALEGEIVGDIPGDPAVRAPLSAAAVTDCTLLEVDMGTLSRLVEADPRVGAALAVEISRELQDTYATLAAVTFGSIQERVAWRLLDLAFEAPADGGLIIAVTEQQLAESLGMAGEAVALVLRELRNAGIVIPTKDQHEITDPVRLVAIAGRRIGSS